MTSFFEQSVDLHRVDCVGDRTDSSVIGEHVRAIWKRIQAAAARAGRASDTIQLIAATKTVPVTRIQAALDAGITHLGENTLQEALPKLEALASRTELVWHFIGQLQRRKVKTVIGRFQLIHSVDSVDLAEEINGRAQEKGLCQAVLLEVNIGGEPSKAGFAVSELFNVLDRLDRMPHLAVKGLMAIPPPTDTPEAARPYFRAIRGVADSVKDSALHRIRMDRLSMGMSDDFEVAIEEGATCVRIGTAIFGSRPTKGRE
jgi:pyridoxal phosphate enzyme (YggS family)